MKERIKGLIDVDWRKIKALQPDDVKINTNINALKKSLKKHGFSIPFAVWKDGSTIYTIDGHTRKRALEELKHEGEEVPDKLKAFEIDAKDRKEAVQILVEVFNQKHNQFDNEVLINWLDVEQVEIQDLEAVNLSSPIIEKSETQEDDFEIPDEDEIETDIKLGDLIEIGRHRLLCGDSTDSDQVAKLMNGEKYDLIVTDPPYNVAYEGGTGLTIMNDKMKSSDFVQFLTDYFSTTLINTKKGGGIYVFFADMELRSFVDAFLDGGFKLSQQLIWLKQKMVMGRKDYHCKHEPILYGWYEGEAHNWYSDRKQTTILEFDRPQRNGEHPTMKPIAILEYLIKNSSKIGDLIGDGFLGSGSTMVAAHQLNRKCYGMELDPKYVEVIVTRMIKLDKSLVIKRNGIEETQKWLDKLA